MRLRAVAVAAAAFALCAVSALPAGGSTDGHGKGRADVVPITKLNGATAGELVGQWWAQVLAIPAAENPIEPPNPGRCLTLRARRGKVATAAANGAVTTTCVIREGTPVFLPATLQECSSAEPPPWRFETEAEQRACAMEIFSYEGVLAILLSVDGGRPVDIHRERFQAVSPQVSVIFPEGAVYGAEPGPATFVGAGYAATIRKPLRRGRHTITTTFVLPEETLIATLKLIVVR